MVVYLRNCQFFTEFSQWWAPWIGWLLPLLIGGKKKDEACARPSSQSSAPFLFILYSRTLQIAFLTHHAWFGITFMLQKQQQQDLLTFSADNLISCCIWDHEATCNNLEMSCPLNLVKDVKDSYINNVVYKFPKRWSNCTSNCIC